MIVGFITGHALIKYVLNFMNIQNNNDLFLYNSNNQALRKAMLGFVQRM